MTKYIETSEQGKWTSNMDSWS